MLRLVETEQSVDAIDAVALDVLRALFEALTGAPPRTLRAYRDDDALLLLVRYDGATIDPPVEIALMALPALVAEAVAKRAGLPSSSAGDASSPVARSRRDSRCSPSACPTRTPARPGCDSPGERQGRGDPASQSAPRAGRASVSTLRARSARAWSGFDRVADLRSARTLEMPVALREAAQELLVEPRAEPPGQRGRLAWSLLVDRLAHDEAPAAVAAFSRKS